VTIEELAGQSGMTSSHLLRVEHGPTTPASCSPPGWPARSG
jgi:hypothetical protein